jgi:serine/threonine protein kinase
MQSTLDHFVIQRKLGEGKFGVVKLGVDPDTSLQYAIKIIKKKYAMTPERFRDLVANEAGHIQEISHPNIVNLVLTNEEGLYTRKGNRGTYTCSYIVMELCPNGELFDVLAVTGRFQERVARAYFRQMIEGIEACHLAGISHRDIKPENILFDANFNLKIADFGVSIVTSGQDGSGLLHSYRGTENYMAPEILERRPYSGVSVDLFAAGVILFIMVDSTPPFSKALLTDLHYSQMTRDSRRYWEIRSRKKPVGFYSDDFRSLIQTMLAVDPTQRLSIAEIKSHPWYNGPFATQEEIYTELSTRRPSVLQAAEIARAQREAQARAAAARERVTGTPRNFRSDLEELDLSDSNGASNALERPPLARKCGVYDPTSWKYSQILSPLETEELFDFVQSFLAKQQAHFEVSPASFKLRSKHTTDGEDLVLEVKILNGDGFACVDLQKLSGSHFDLMELFHSLESKLEKHTASLISTA